MNKLTAIRIKYDDGTYSDEIPVSTLAEYILWDDSHNLVDILGNIDMSKGTVQAQLNDKIDDNELDQYLNDEISTDVTNWLNTHVTPVGSAVIVDSSLTIEGAAADAAATGAALTANYTELTEEVSELNERLLLLDDNVPNTVQTYTFTNGSVFKVEHKNGNTIIRSDIFTYGATTITETRTLNTGAVLTIVTNLTTLETTVTYTAA